MKSIREMHDYLYSRDFLLDTMVHRDGDNFVYLEPIKRNSSKDMVWINNCLTNCDYMVKHVGPMDDIADIIANRFGIDKTELGGEELYKIILETLEGLPEVVDEKQVK